VDLLHRAVEYFVQGGWVMGPLSLCSLIMWALIGERALFFYAQKREDIDIREAIEMLEGRRPAAGGRGLRARLVKNFLKERTGMRDLDRNLLYHWSLREKPLLRRRLAAIGVLASVAPLLGLLGTVIGMVHTFQVITLFGTGNTKALSSGISVALITTEAGLIVAIPGLFLSGWLCRRADRLERRLEEITAVLMRHVGRRVLP